jgi:hypothetical protein
MIAIRVSHKFSSLQTNKHDLEVLMYQQSDGMDEQHLGN